MKNLYTCALVLLLTSCSQSNAGTNPTRDPNATPIPAPAATQALATRPLLTAVPIDDLPMLGERDALVTIVEFTDYECPYCQRAEVTMRALRAKYGADLRIAIGENPLPMHEHAQDAALAALAADPAHFESVHTLLFDHPAEHSSDDLAKIGSILGLGRSYDDARASSATADALAKSQALAVSVHAKGTPMFFVNGRKIGGAQTFETFDAVVAEELAHAHDLTAAGVPRTHVYDAILDEARAHPAPFEIDNDAPVLVPAAKSADGALLYGRANASTTIVLFTDFECPYCAKLDARLRDLVAAHDDVRVVLRNHPLPMHPHAPDAAKAAIAADAQGKLGALAPILFANRTSLDRPSLLKYAALAGLDMPRFTRDIDSPETAARLAVDQSLGDSLGVTGTPTSFFEGYRVVGAQLTPTLEAALARATAQ